MCGVAGIVALGGAPPTRAELERMASALSHRGPDELGTYRDAHAGLAHARLSIIDLAGGQQPLSNEDGTLWIAYNGEIFNYVELAAELAARGHVFRTRSDTEVIVHAYEEWGDAAWARLNGQWAVALWDARARRLVLSRDPLGVRPLYTVEHAGRLYFASELCAIFAADPTVPRALDPAGLAETFTFWTVVPPRSVFAGVRELPPGHVRTVSAAGAREAAHFSLDFTPRFRGTIDEAAEAVRAALEQATRLRMLRADVPVGSYLSGGLDSSLVAALGLAAKGERFHTFSLRFDDAEYDETEYQRLMVAALGSEHHEVVVTRRAIADAFPAVVRHAERPLLRTAPAPLYLLSELVRASGIKVVLTGEGADELFAGYDLFREGKVRRFWARQPSSTLRPRLLERLYPYLARSPVAQRALAQQFFGQDLAAAGAPGFAHQTRWRGTAALQRLFRPELRAAAAASDVVGALLAALPSRFAAWDPLAQDQWLEVRTLLGGYLLSSQGDRMLMAHSVEGRFPFLDRDVVELATSLPAAYKLAVLDEKHVVKRAARGLVPAAILARKKQPYRAPDALCFAGPDRPEWVDAALAPDALFAAGVFDPGPVTRLWDKCRDRVSEGQFSNSDNMALCGVLSTQLLHQALCARLPDVTLRPLTIRVEAAC
jgi:asparagine synthase (glutamine-hydrolysing)